MTEPQAATAGYPVMLDSVDPYKIPPGTEKVAGYADGNYQWMPGEWERFTGHKVRITVEPWSPAGGRDWPNGRWRDAAVMDVEKGAFTIGNAVKFIPHRNSFRPHTATVYISEARLNQLLSAARGHHYWLWLAWWLDHEPTAAEIQAVRNRVTPYGVRLAAWQWKPGALFDTSSVIDPEWLTAS